MPAPILVTKLYAPPPRAKIVQRTRLIEPLNAGLAAGGKLTLISAPAGFGKTTLLSEWVAGCGRPVAWLSLDEGDDDPGRFLTYLVASLQTISKDVGERVVGAIQTSQTLTIIDEVLLATLINEIAAIPDNFILVFDDYHVIDAQVMDQAIAFLIEHQPPQMHLVIASREDPNLPIARLRARGRLTELRAADLRFTSIEAAEFLNQVMGLHLSAYDIAALENRTEGWIAGLQLAALSMKSSQDVAGFIQAFTGDHRYIADYLVEEVLQRQPETVRSFLLQTAILDRLSGPLCDAVTGQPGGAARLESLHRGNFFVVPLDDKRQWYRYHQLFADVLFMYLRMEQPDLVAVLHRRASEWYELNGYIVDAINHALVAQDFERAANLIERAFPAMARSRQEVTLLGWLNALPEAVVCDRPVLCNLYAGVLMQTGELESVETWLLAAEKHLAATFEGDEQPEIRPPTKVVVDQEEYRRLPGAVAMHRAGQALMLGNVAETIQHARRVHDLAPQDDFLRRGGAAALLGLAYWTLGDLETARRVYPQAIMSLQRAGYLSDSIGCALALADIVIAQGHLHEAMGIYEQALRIASEHGEPNLRGTADMLVGMSELHYEQNDLREAAECVLRAKEQGEHTGLPQNRYRLRTAMARLREAEGDPNSALGLLDEAERLYRGDFSPNICPVSALKTRVLIAQGRLAEALDWSREKELSADDSLSYLHEFEHLTLVRMLLAEYASDRLETSIWKAIGLLERLLKAAEEGGRVGSMVEILVLQALAQQALGDIPAALLPLRQALILAEPEGYVRMFIGEGAGMARLLSEAAAHGIVPDYTGKLLEACAGDSPSSAVETLPPAPRFIIDPLSQRELEVLRLFKTELSGPEIARELVVALSTVRTHTKSIYSKLNVNSRRAAVIRAIELGLI